MENFFDKYINTVNRIEPIKYTGKVIGVKGLLVESNGPRSVIGEICSIQIPSQNTSILAEVVGFEGNTVRLTPYGDIKGIVDALSLLQVMFLKFLLGNIFLVV